MKIIIIIFFYISIFTTGFGQTNKIEKEIFENINKIRFDQKSKNIKQDSLFSHYNVWKYMSERTYVNKDSLRKLLRKYFIYDYNVDIVTLRIKDPSELTKSYLKKNNTKLYSLINDTTFNNVDISYNIVENEYLAQFLFRKNLINLSNEINIYSDAPNDLSHNKVQKQTHIIIKGNTKFKRIFYCKVNDLSEIKQNKTSCSTMNDIIPDIEGNFMIDIEGSDGYILLCDGNKNVLSIYSYLNGR